mmetsp:Transcript_19532/g.27088  ORF Transcript_19532/g.27088 Transcript_19532/m.27088 type:complete len:93 (-) Transcript_19532:206-484(-)
MLRGHLPSVCLINMMKLTAALKEIEGARDVGRCHGQRSQTLPKEKNVILVLLQRLTDRPTDGQHPCSNHKKIIQLLFDGLWRTTQVDSDGEA